MNKSIKNVKVEKICGAYRVILVDYVGREFAVGFFDIMDGRSNPIKKAKAAADELAQALKDLLL